MFAGCASDEPPAAVTDVGPSIPFDATVADAAHPTPRDGAVTTDAGVPTPDLARDVAVLVDVALPIDAPSPPPDAGPRCDPPNSVLVGGACVPSCGVAGGNTCVDATSTLCEGIAPLRAHDCAACCRRPSFAGPVGPHSFHVINREAPTHWDAILGLSNAHPAVLIASQNRPALLAPARWARMMHTSFFPSGASMAAGLNAILVDAANAPLVVMVDELNEGTIPYIAELARTMRTRYPQWRGRWGAFTTQFTGGQPGVDELLQADAHVAAERYIARSWYCEHGANGGERDIALARFFDGDDTLARYDWLVARRAALRSQSPLTVVFGVTDAYLDGINPGIFLDRMFYVWVTRTRHPAAIAIASGGPGAWKWDPNGSPGNSSTARDALFAESVAWYSVAGNRGSRLGPVPCP